MGPGREFDLIRSLRDHWSDLAPQIGDDAAVVRIPRGEQVVATTDVALEDVHFKRAWLTLREIGFRAVTAALSDVAAMAAAPAGVLVSLELSADAEEGLLEIADGIADAVREAGTTILGGNLARSGVLGITTTALGSAMTPLTRSGARPGDLVYVTGTLGGPGAALRAFRAGQEPGAALRARFAHPSARISEARWLAAHGAIAGIDISDGLSSDAMHLAAANAVSIEIQVERIPAIAGASEDDALAGGEEYELLVASRAPLPDQAFASRFGIPLTAIGRVTEGPPDVAFSRAGRRVAAPSGYDHFSR